MNLLEGTARPSTLYFGDCLDVMQQWDPGQADLIYLDPPFNSKTKYNILFGSKTDGRSAQFMAFDDTWQWDAAAADRVSRLKGMKARPVHAAIAGLELQLGDSGMLAYLSYMVERLLQCHRMLKSNGTIYLHCDPSASHYLKVVMDGVFGAQNFLNEIIWCYRGGGVPKNAFARKHDVILRYSKNGNVHFERQYVPYSEASTALVEKRGGISIDNRKRDLDRGAAMPDWWTDINSLQTWSPERLGYPTQKPTVLLERIIKASSREGDLVLDPFCGCGTTMVAAERLKRKWIGIDISSFAVESVMRRRLKKYGYRVRTEGIPVDLAGATDLARSKPFKFETWAVFQVPGMVPNTKQVGDKGIDGVGTLLFPADDGRDGVIAQVKSGHTSPGHLREFLYNVNKDANNAACGVFITLAASQVSEPMRRDAKAQGTYRIEGSAREYPRVQFWHLDEWFDHDKDPRFLPDLPPMKDPFTGKEMHRTLYEQELRS